MPAGHVAEDPESSVELLRRAQGGDHAARNRLFQRYLPVLRRWASGRLPQGARDLSNTDDLVQDCIMRAIRHLDDFEPRHDGAFLAYLRQILANRVLEEIRKARNRPVRPGNDAEVADDSPSQLETVIGWENLERYESALARLKPEDRCAIVLRVEFAYDYPALARALGKPSPNAARMAVMRALMRLAREIERE
jgi:RNA polymerase sigma-70 factor (ECF subfamily)